MYTNCKIIRIYKYVYIYKGLIDKISGMPTLIGRAIDEDEEYYFDGIFEFGYPSDFGRTI